MREVIPFASVGALIRALDQGATFLGLRHGKGDLELSVGEIENAARNARNDISMARTSTLFLALLASEIPAHDTERFYSHLSRGMAKRLSREWLSPMPASKAISRMTRSLVLADGILEPADPIEKGRLYFSGDTWGRIGDDFTAYRLLDAPRSSAGALVLGSFWWTLPAGFSMRLAAEVRFHKGSDGKFHPYLAPQFYWLKTTPPRREEASVKVFAPLKEALAHVPGHDAETSRDDEEGA